jgi:hypothetical protein
MTRLEWIQSQVELHYPGIEFDLVRHSYMLEDISTGEVLLAKAGPSSFPGQTYGHRWELFSCSFYHSFFLRGDVVEDAKRDLEQFTRLPIRLASIVPVLMGTFLWERETAIPLNTTTLKAHLHAHSFLNLYYHVIVNDRTDFKPWLEFHKEVAWLPKRDAISTVEVEMDADVLWMLMHPAAERGGLMRL